MKKRLEKNIIKIIKRNINSNVRLPLLAVFCFLCICLSCQNGHEKITLSIQKIDSVQIAMKSLEDGDLITRTGNDITSRQLCLLSQKDPTYSHIGIAWKENGHFFVYHAIGDEFHPDAPLRKDSVENFISPTQNLGFGIFRFYLSTKEKEALHARLLNAFATKLPYDMLFDLTTDNRQYCSEFVAKAIENTLHRPHLFSTYHLAGKEYIAADNIFLQSSCQEIIRLRYF